MFVETPPRFVISLLSLYVLCSISFLFSKEEKGMDSYLKVMRGRFRVFSLL
jgi:hypothetical protein